MSAAEKTRLATYEKLMTYALKVLNEGSAQRGFRHWGARCQELAQKFHQALRTDDVPAPAEAFWTSGGIELVLASDYRRLQQEVLALRKATKK